MPGNVITSFSSFVPCVAVNSVRYTTEGGYKYGNSITASPNTFYNFGTANKITFNLSGLNDKVYQEYMFQFVALSDDVSLSIKSNSPLYWVRPVVTKKDYLYQFSVVNGVVLWMEVSTI